LARYKVPAGAIPDGIRRFGTRLPASSIQYSTEAIGGTKPGARRDDSVGHAPLRCVSLWRVSVLMQLFYHYLCNWLLITASQRARENHLQNEITDQGGVPGSTPLKLTNGSMTSEWFRDGQGTIRIEGSRSW